MLSASVALVARLTAAAAAAAGATTVRASRLLSSDSASAPGQPIRVTEACARRLLELQRSQQGDSGGPARHLRVSVEGGGCSGFQYKFQLDSLPQQQLSSSGDCVIDCPGGVKVLIDSESLELLRGCTLDYQRELIREGFKVTANPQAEKGCSCGASFAVRMD